MANWLFTLDIHDAWTKSQEGTLPLMDLVKILTQKLDELALQVATKFKTESLEYMELAGIIECYKEAIIDDTITQGEFNSLFEELYNWGDECSGSKVWPPSKLCWIATITSVKKTN